MSVAAGIGWFALGAAIGWVFIWLVIDRRRRRAAKPGPGVYGLGSDRGLGP